MTIRLNWSRSRYFFVPPASLYTYNDTIYYSYAYRPVQLKLGNISLDGTKIHTDASKSKAVSYQHLLAADHETPQHRGL
jgi:hypothetical protein